MKKVKYPLLAAGLVAASFLQTGNHQAKAQDITFIDNVKPVLEFRPRYEHVHDKNNTAKDANALTIRARVGAKIGSIFSIPNLKGYIEATYVGALIDNYFPEKPNYDTVADPNNTRITQAYLSYSFGKTTFLAGRKFVAIDDHRFIGTVNWRQMPQSFGIVGVVDNTIPNLNIILAGIYERKGVLNKLNMDWRMDKMPIIADVSYKVIPQLRLKGFAYLITDVHNTYGVKASGKFNLQEGVKLSYLAEYAKQTDPYQKDNLSKKPDIDTDYYRAGLNANAYGVLAGVEYTYFGDKNGHDKGFSTPLATLHKFEGWADALLTGSANGFDYGLNEYKLSLGYKHNTYGKVLASYLIFRSDKSQPTGKSIGNEIDLLYAKKLTKRFSFLAKAAFYNGKDGYYTGGNLKASQDITKYWVQLDYKY